MMDLSEDIIIYLEQYFSPLLNDLFPLGLVSLFLIILLYFSFLSRYFLQHLFLGCLFIFMTEIRGCESLGKFLCYHIHLYLQCVRVNFRLCLREQGVSVDASHLWMLESIADKQSGASYHHPNG